MSSITNIASGDLITNSRVDINNNFSALNADKMETSVLDTDTTLAANSDAKIPSQKAVKAYIDAGGNPNASETARGIVQEATTAEITAGTSTGTTGAKLFVTPTKLAAYVTENTPLSIFGDGSDGDVTLSVNTTLASNKDYRNLTVSSGVILDTAGYIVSAKLISNSGSIRNNGGNGGNGANAVSSGGAGGTAGTAGAGSTVAAGKAGKAGGAGGTAAGAVGAGVAGEATNPSLGASGSAGGAGGTGAAAGGASGAGGTATSETVTAKPFLTTVNLTSGAVDTASQILKFTGSTSSTTLSSSGGSGSGGGGGGSGGTVSHGGGGGGSGGTGGLVVLISETITNGASGTIQANGGTGGNGGNAALGVNGGGGGGGAGGNGGNIFLAYETLNNSGTIQATGGTGGTGGAPIGGGANGNDGTVGTAGKIYKVSIS